MIVSRRGPATAKNLTPRPGKDTVPAPGRAPGLSVWTSLQLSPKEKAQVLDLNLLNAPLRAIPDDPVAGGEDGHYAIAPISGSGSIDQAALDDWAASRDTAQRHPFTDAVRAAIVGELKG